MVQIAIEEESDVDRLSTLLEAAYAAALNIELPVEGVSFWDLGGSSLQFASVVADIARQMDGFAPMSVLLADTRARQVATVLLAHRAGTDDAARVEWIPALVRGCVLRQMLAPADIASNCLMVWEIEGAVDVTALTTAVVMLRERHQALRSIFGVSGVIHTQSSTDWIEIQLFDDRTHSEALREVVEVLEKPLAPQRGVVARAAIARVDARRTILGVVVHHAAFDGFSEHVLAGDIGDLYRQSLMAEPVDSRSVMPSLDLQEAYDLVSTPRRLETFNQQLAAAQRSFAGTAALTDQHRRVGIDDCTADVIALPFPRAQQLRFQAREAGVSYFTLLLAGYARSLSRLVEAEDVTFGVPVNRRMGSFMQGTLGNFVTMLPVHVSSGRGRSTDAALADAVLAWSSALERLDVEIDELGRLLPPQSHGHLYNHVFALQDNPDPQLSLPSADVRFVRQPYRDIASTSMLEVWPPGTGYSDSTSTVVLSYRRHELPPESAHRLVVDFLDFLA